MRLVDSSIWIAFARTGWLDRLLQLEGIAISQGVHRELKRGRDSLAERTEGIVTSAVEEMELADAEAKLLREILQFGAGISQVDAQQAAYVRRNPDTCLYMRDGKAETEAARGGGDVRGHSQLVEDMQNEEILTAEEASQLRNDLDQHYSKRRRNR